MKKYLILMMVVVMMSIYILPTYSQGLVSEKPYQNRVDTKLEEKKSIREELLLKLRKQRCERITERVQNKINGYEKNREKHVIRYRNIEKRFEKLITELKKLNIDTTKLENEIGEYKNLVNIFLEKYNKFVDSIKGAKNYACNEDDNVKGFKGSVEKSRIYLKEAREAGKEIHIYYKETLKPTLIELKNQYLESKLNNNSDEK